MNGMVTRKVMDVAFILRRIVTYTLLRAYLIVISDCNSRLIVILGDLWHPYGSISGSACHVGGCNGSPLMKLHAQSGARSLAIAVNAFDLHITEKALDKATVLKHTPRKHSTQHNKS